MREIKQIKVTAVGGVHMQNCMSETAKKFHVGFSNFCCSVLFQVCDGWN